MTTPVIIEAAINGATTKATNPNVPTTAEEIAADALAVIDAGAAIVHAHCDPVSGPDDEVAARSSTRSAWCGRSDRTRSCTRRPTSRPAASASATSARSEAGLRIGLLDPGSVNFGRLDDDGLPTGSFVYQNSFDRIREVFAYHDELGLGPSLAIYEPGFLYTTVLYQRRGKLPRGAMVKFYLSTERGLAARRSGCHRPSPRSTPTSTSWAMRRSRGRCQSSVATSAAPTRGTALERGGHLHLGLEFYGGDRQPTNVELVEEAVALAKAAGRPLASCTEAARILDLPR